MAPPPATDHGYTVIRVLVADDHPAVRSGLAALLDGVAGIEIAAQAENALEITAGMRGSRPDVVLLDHRLPGEPGLAVCRRIKREPMSPAVAIYSAFALEHLTVPALVAGADAVIDKGAPASELLYALNELAAGNTLLPEVTPLDLMTAAAAVDDDDVPMLCLLAGDDTRANIADALHLMPAELELRIDAMLDRLLGATLG